MGKIDDEVVRFIAQMDLDPETTAQFEAKINATEKHCNELRDSIARTSAEMLKMKAAGDDTSDAYRKLEDSLKADKTALKAATKEMKGYGQALDVSKMSMSELKQRSSMLRGALNTLHKEANPQLWDKYQKELDQVNDRMKELKGGSKETGKSLGGMMGQITGGFTLASVGMKAVAGLTNTLKKGWETFVSQTQVWGDWWQMTTVTLTAGWNQLIANFGQGTRVIKASVKEAMEAAREAQLLRDELFERDNSFRLLESQARAYINEQQAIAMDSSKSSAERTKALDNIIAKEEELATMKRDIAAQERNAALAELKARTSLTEEQLQVVIDQYEKNRDIIQQAQEYNGLLADVARAEDNIGQARDSSSAKYYGKQLEEARTALDKFKAAHGQAVEDIAGFLRQYDLGNDDLVNSYVESTLKMQQADIDLTSAKAAQARRRGSLAKQIAAEEKAARTDRYNDDKKAIDDAYNRQLLTLTQQLEKREISEELYRAKSTSAELEMLEKKKQLAERYGESTVDIERQIASKRVALQKSINAALDDKDFDKWVESQAQQFEAAIDALYEELDKEVEEEMGNLDLLPSTEELLEDARQQLKALGVSKYDILRAEHESELALLQQQYDDKLILEEEFQERKKEINSSYSKELGNMMMGDAETYLTVVSQMLDGVGQIIDNAKNAEIANVEARMQEELAMAGDNAEKRKAIEEKAARQKMEITKKYADAEMVIDIAKTLANGAVAAMRAIADLGPIAGGVMAGILAGVAAAQVAVIIGQRNVVKSTQMGGSSASPSGSAGPSGRVPRRPGRGFSDGGYTGDGGRFEPAGIVHRGEYVVPKPMMKDPQVRDMVRELERRRLTGPMPISGRPGFADGGYTSGRPDADVLNDILQVLQSIEANPTRAEVVLEDIEKMFKIRNRFKSQTSLK